MEGIIDLTRNDMCTVVISLPLVYHAAVKNEKSFKSTKRDVDKNQKNVSGFAFLLDLSTKEF